MWHQSQATDCCSLQVPAVSPHTDIFILRDVLQLQQTAPAPAQQQTPPLQQTAAAGLMRLYAVHAYGKHTTLTATLPIKYNVCIKALLDTTTCPSLGMNGKATPSFDKSRLYLDCSHATVSHD